MGRELPPEGPLFEHPISGTLGTPSAVNLIECPGKGLSSQVECLPPQAPVFWLPKGRHVAGLI